MKFNTKLFIGIISAGIMTGCWGNSENANTGNPANPTTANTGQPVSNEANPIPANVNVTVSNTENPIPANANIQVTKPTNVQVSEKDIPGFPGSANANIKKVDVDINKIKPTVPTVAGPDNSTVSSTLAEYPIETRVFKANKNINKIERTTVVPEKDVRVKVYLKNGQVKEFKQGNLDVMKATGDEIFKSISGTPTENKTETEALPPPPPAKNQ